MKGLRRLATGGILLREIRGLRRAMERLATLEEQRFARDYPTLPVADPTAPPVEVTFATDAQQIEWMDIELGLTQALGQPPSEEAMLAEWYRRHPESMQTQGQIG